AKVEIFPQAKYNILTNLLVSQRGSFRLYLKDPVSKQVEMNKNLFVLTLLLTIILLVASCSPEQKIILRVGTDAENPPFTYLENSEFKGIDIDICEKIADKMGMQLQITQYEFDDLFSALAQNKIDLAASTITITEKRKQTFEFSEPYFQTNLAVVARKASPIEINKIEDIGKYRVGCQSSTTSYQYLKENLVDKDLLPKEKLKTYSTLIETIGELLNKKIDLMVFDEWVAKKVSEQVDIKIVYIIPTNEQYGLAMRPGKEINLRINKALKELKDSGELQRIINEYIK
ncbi:MAG: ABC transporter substrate-binding protein, partial [Candidatus Cloacimonas sp.]